MLAAETTSGPSIRGGLNRQRLARIRLTDLSLSSAG
jgi:hypothetical protein